VRVREPSRPVGEAVGIIEDFQPVAGGGTYNPAEVGASSLDRHASVIHVYVQNLPERHFFCSDVRRNGPLSSPWRTSRVPRESFLAIALKCGAARNSEARADLENRGPRFHCTSPDPRHTDERT